MATNAGGRARTAPKGRATHARNQVRDQRRMSSTVQWGLVLLAIIVVLAVIIWIGRDWRSNVQGGAAGIAATLAAAVDVAASAVLGT